jgi:hypothetical protein
MKAHRPATPSLTEIDHWAMKGETVSAFVSQEGQVASTGPPPTRPPAVPHTNPLSASRWEGSSINLWKRFGGCPYPTPNNRNSFVCRFSRSASV